MLVLSAGALACHSGGPHFPTAPNAAKNPSVPPGLPLEPSLHPPMRRAAPASEGVVTLRSPEDPRGIYRLVRRLFEAISTESNVELQALLAEHSVARLAGGTTQSAFATWVRRFSAGDYALLKPEALYRETDVRVYTSLDIERLAEPPATVLRPAPEEVLVQVPLRTQMAGGKVLFGTTLELLLRTTNGGLLIAALAEDYQPE